jgi:hypothetical protein
VVFCMLGCVRTQRISRFSGGQGCRSTAGVVMYLECAVCSRSLLNSMFRLAFGT